MKTPLHTLLLATAILCVQAQAQDNVWKDILKDATKKAVDKLLDDSSGTQTGGQKGGKKSGQDGGQGQSQGDAPQDTATGQTGTSDSVIDTTTETPKLSKTLTCADYAIGYPDTWAANNEKTQSGDNCLYHKNYATGQLKILIRRKKVDASITLDEFLGKLKSDMKGSNPKARVSESTPQIYSAGNTMVKGAAFDFESQEGTTTLHGRMLAVPIVDGYYVLLYIGDSRLFKQFEPIATAILKSFALSPELLVVKSGGNSSSILDDLGLGDGAASTDNKNQTPAIKPRKAPATQKNQKQ